jgi:ParB-like chromosome segregation protein Spo0J
VRDARAGIQGDVVTEMTLRLPIAVLKPDPVNPRRISPEALAGLGISAEEFGDLGTIVWNERSGELVCGHQRMEVLRQAGAQEWEREGDRGVVVHPKTGERFPVRIVDWDETKQRMANLVANSPEIAGDFTEETKAQLRELENHALFEALRLDALQDELGKELKTAAADADEVASTLADSFAVVVDCSSETEQIELLERLKGEGYKVKALIQ